MNIVGMKGFLRVRTRNIFSGKITQDTGWFENTILNAGRNVMASRSDWMNYCQVGTDNTAPNQNDTSLFGYIAGTSNIVSVTTGQASSAPYYGWKRKIFRFAIGDTAANLNEVGIGWGLTGSTLISRALILDPILQIPTTITPLIDEFLEVLYELRYYAPTNDVVLPQVTLNGIIYDTITRASRVTNAIWSTNIGSQIGVIKSASSWRSYDGSIGTVLTAPNGSYLDNDTNNQYDTAYANNSYEVQLNNPVGSTAWNQNIRCMWFQTTTGEYQTQFTASSGGAAVLKTTAYTMLMKWKLAWVEL